MTLVQYLHRPLVILVKYLWVASFLVVNFSSELSRPVERVAKKGGGANFGMLKLTFGGFSNSMTLKDETVGSPQKLEIFPLANFCSREPTNNQHFRSGWMEHPANFFVSSITKNQSHYIMDKLMQTNSSEVGWLIVDRNKYKSTHRLSKSKQIQSTHCCCESYELKCVFKILLC